MGGTRREREIRRLAEEAAADPTVVDADLISRLARDELHGLHFWRPLGEVDAENKWLPILVALAADQEGLSPFAHYSFGLSRRDPECLRQVLSDLTESGEVTGAALIAATGKLPADEAAVRRVERLIAEERVHPGYAGYVLGNGTWSRDLSDRDYLRFVQAVSGPDLESAAVAIDCLGTRLFHHGELSADLVEFAWRCLETVPVDSRGIGYQYDRVAASLVEFDPDRALALLQSLLSQPYDRHSWSPANEPHYYEFWRKLLQVDAPEVIRMAVTAQREPSSYWVDQEIPEFLAATADITLLLQVAQESQELAQAVAVNLHYTHPEFLQLAAQLVGLHPRNSVIPEVLTREATNPRAMRPWPDTPRLDQLRQQIATLQNDPTTPEASRTWLWELDAQLEDVLARQPEDVDDWLRFRDSRGSDGLTEEQTWAAAQALRLRREQMRHPDESDDHALEGS